MKFLTPLAMTTAQLVSSSVAENDYAVWSAATTYAVAAKVIDTTTHRIYESRQASNLNHALTDAAWWRDIGPTNRWAMFDSAIGSATTGTNPIVVEIAPSQSCGTLALLDLVATSVQIVVEYDSVTIYDKTYTMADYRPSSGWWDYLFAPLSRQTSLIVTDLPAAGNITVTINGTACGTLALGTLFEVGRTLAQPTISIIDYSRKETDEYGYTSVTERGYAKRMEVRVSCDSARVDTIVNALATVRATPVVWLGDDSSTYASLLIYGFYKDWDVVISYPNISDCRLTIEGLST